MHPEAARRHTAREIEQAAPQPSSAGAYSRFLVPIELITVARGRERFNESYKLFRRLDEIAMAYKAPHLPHDRAIMAIWQGDQHVAETGVEALEMLLRTTGLKPFFRASSKLPHAGRAARSKWNWNALGEYLGWEWISR